jgi:hypothetical protein
MKHKYVELDIYEDFINGKLEPSKMNGADLSFISKYLTEEFENCQDMILGKFKKRGNQYELVEKLKISTAHPLAAEYFKDSQLQLPQLAKQSIPEPIIAQLEVKHMEDDCPILFKKIQNITQIGIPSMTEWNNLESDRLKYYYFNHQLNELVRKTKSNLRTDVFSCKEEKAKELIQGIQKLLLSFLQDLVSQYELKENDLIIKVKAQYTNKDCASLIYLSIVELLNFIYNHFPDKMDHQQVVPFYAKAANQNEFVATSKHILKILNIIDIHDKLLETISDQLEKVLKLNVETRITYEELNYFKGFLRTFLRLLEKNQNNPTVEDLINRFLISYNFNDYLYFEYLTEKFHHEILTCENTLDMEFYLLKKQKEFNQIVSIGHEKLIPNQDDIMQSLREWIDNESDYVSKMIKKNYSVIKTPHSNTIQLTSQLNLAELSLLFKLMDDKEYITSKSKNELSRWIIQSFKNVKGEPYSFQNIKNNMYNVLPKSKERVKNINIALVNELNSI